MDKFVSVFITFGKRPSAEEKYFVLVRDHILRLVNGVLLVWCLFIVRLGDIAEREKEWVVLSGACDGNILACRRLVWEGVGEGGPVSLREDRGRGRNWYRSREFSGVLKLAVCRFRKS